MVGILDRAPQGRGKVISCRVIWILAAAVAAPFGAGSCAYTTRAANLPPHIKTIAVPVFENETTEHTLEQDMTNAVIQRFVNDNHLRIVDEHSASAVLRGKITSYRNSVFGISTSALAQEYRVTIGVSVVFKDLVKNREVWSDDNIIKTANYYVQNVPGETARTELDGRREVIQKIADEIISRSVESW